MTALKWILSIFLFVSVMFVSVFGINCVYGYIFPIKFQEEVALASQETDLGEDVIFSVINIESHFNKNAVSPKGAIGLMQVKPSTAAELQKSEAGWEEQLKDPSTNIMIGSKYLAQLLKRFENLDTALCAYNAGPTIVKNWLTNQQYSTDGKTISNIPYAETRNYLDKFHQNLRYYKHKV